MHTPGHVVLSALALGRGRWRAHWAAITAGAVAPDLPMVAFYAWERVVAELPEHEIWSRAYFEPGWQAAFDLAHSLPLLLAGALVAGLRRSPAGLAFCASAGLHSLADFLLHHGDAHAHAFPLSGWRFRSPVSYWDPAHHGLVGIAAELALVVLGSLALVRRGGAWRGVGIATLAAPLALALWAALVWVRSVG